ncbi:MAG: hypothetical protein HY231_18075 [Acidobacteria bacterium]|nr:hypothetical protein [Acidobacteriota bacterium]
MASDAEEAKRRRREDREAYVYRRPNDPINEGFHSHYCRVCGEDHECTLEDCDLAPQTICHNCFYQLEEGEL